MFTQALIWTPMRITFFPSLHRMKEGTDQSLNSLDFFPDLQQTLCNGRKKTLSSCSYATTFIGGKHLVEIGKLSYWFKQTLRTVSLQTFINRKRLILENFKLKSQNLISKIYLLESTSKLKKWAVFFPCLKLGNGPWWFLWSKRWSLEIFFWLMHSHCCVIC